MSETYKSRMTVDGNHVRMSMPFAKVDKENRLVSGYATLDNIDSQGDIVLAEASAKAFARARGNIREMHQPIAVGKMVDFKEEEYFDNETGKLYRGIFVTARVSKGAQDTWEKVLDETLTGFSIGGEINEASNEFVKDANNGKGGTVRFIKDYDLTELSLVDNPANQLANVLSIQKSATGSVTVTMGEASDTVVENVFVCSNDDVVIVKDTESESCPLCGTKMENAGWFESGGDRAEKVHGIVTKFRTPADKEDAQNSTSEGGVEMSNVKKGNDTVPESEETSVPNPSETHSDGEPVEDEAKATVEREAEEAEDVNETEGTDEEETAETPDEVTDEETEISKKIDELHEAVKSSLDASKEETLAKVGNLEQALNSVRDEFLTKASELEAKIDGFGEKVEAQKSRLAELESSLNKMNDSDAFRKSADVTPAGRVVQDKTFWGNAFSGS